MCDDREVFYRVRDNYVDNYGQQWLVDFRNDPFFKLIIDMMSLKVTCRQARNRWKVLCKRIPGQIQIITVDYLWRNFGVDKSCLRVQDGIDRFSLLDATILDRQFYKLVLKIVMHEISELKEWQPYQKQLQDQLSKTKARQSFVGCFHSQTLLSAHFLYDFVSSTFLVYFLIFVSKDK